MQWTQVALNLFSSQVNQDTSSNSLISKGPNSGEHLLQESTRDLREKNGPVRWYKFIAPMIPKHVMTGSSITEPTPVHVAYSPLVSMNHWWTIHLHDGYPPLYVLIPEEYIPPSLPTLCNLTSTMFHFAVDFLYSTQDTNMIFPV